VVPRHTILVQYFPLYILPVIMIVLGYFFFSLLGFCKNGPARRALFIRWQRAAYPDYRPPRR
jgi:hypothetical protein